MLAIQPRFGFQVRSHRIVPAMLVGSGAGSLLSSRRNHSKSKPSAVVPSLLDGLTPTAIEQVPAHRDSQAHFETDAAGPAELTLDSRTIDCVAPIVAGPVRYQRDQVTVGLASAGEQSGTAIGGHQFFECRANFAYDLEVSAFAFRSYIVVFSDSSAGQNCQNRFAMIAHENPVPHILTVAIDGNRLACYRL